MTRIRVAPEVFAAAHRAARQVLEGKARLTEAQKTLSAQYGIAERTASGYIGCFLAMRRGTTFKTIVSANGLRFMLERIAEDGPGDLMIALRSVMSHITYLQEITGRELGQRETHAGLRRVHAEFLDRLREVAAPAEVTSSLDREVNKALSDTPEARARRLQQAPQMPDQQVVLTRIFRRNPDVIAEVLFRANGVCEGCIEPAPFRRANGRPYLEVHHCQPLAEGGMDTVENAIALCPNCHRERHYGAKFRDAQQ
ncbi:HNH endonuclease [Paraburkholderia fungorum]|uniref:HNH endonuclease n=1 Tax=Paraburkholderia fungorum TaxID=134537 RepID=UPI0020922CC5|nr:HNH endonuclease signature motif containing protein [Paraburkholderia fungorum]USU16103.1 HNH endonuclease [Paraburkholderia fungorum]USU24047.1 HNH endonuclease [Paraburkholderia fungorum]